MTQLEIKLTTYRPSDQSLATIRQTTILFLVGATGSGKDAIKQKLLETGDYHHIVSHTTRPPRLNHGQLEEDGQAYHFINLEAAEQMLDNQAFIEAKLYSGNVYGTSTAEIQTAYDQHKIAITDIEVQGVAEYKTIDPHVIAVFVLPPSFAVWQSRLQKRYGQTMDLIDYRRRMQTAAQELQEFFSHDYYLPVINDDLDQASKMVNDLAHGGSYDASERQKAQLVATELQRNIQNHLHELSQ